MRRAAVDTGALLALASSRDQYHRRAVATEARFRRSGGRWVASALVLAELHGHLLRRIEPQPARRVIGALLADPIFEWHDATVELVRAAVERWLTGYADQQFSLTDAVTFELMRRERIPSVFAFDQDFATAGFTLLD
ncbi:MAG: type II toxin-antitoxin system VapC family toxin [Gemmatimonadales bacterium]